MKRLVRADLHGSPTTVIVKPPSIYELGFPSCHAKQIGTPMGLWKGSGDGSWGATLRGDAAILGLSGAETSCVQRKLTIQ